MALLRYPVDNFKTEWNTTAGYGFGAPTPYGFHDGTDLNKNAGGDSDLGAPLYAIADGTILTIHDHPEIPSFGKHFFLQIDGPWGTRFVHYSHCNAIHVTQGQKVTQGQHIADVGKSGTQWAHDHFAIKKKPNGMDSVANSLEELHDVWEDPIAFIEQWIAAGAHMDEALRQDRDINWNMTSEITAYMGVSADPNDKPGTVRRAKEKIDFYNSEIRRLADLAEEYKKKYKDEEQKNIDLNQANTIISDENQDNGVKAYDAEKAAEERADIIKDVAKELKLTYDATKGHEIRDKILEEIFLLQQKAKELPPLPGEPTIQRVAEFHPGVKRSVDLLYPAKWFVGLFVQ